MNFHHHLVIRSLAIDLNCLLRGKKITAIWSQTKDEVIVELELGKSQYFYIKADLTPEISLLSFPNEVKRAKKNTADIFPALFGKDILSIYPIAFDRTIVFEIEGNKYLIYKMHAKWSNLISPSETPPLFKNNLKKDANNPFELLVPFDFTAEFSSNNLDRIEKIQGPFIMNLINFYFPDYPFKTIREKIEINISFNLIWEKGSLHFDSINHNLIWQEKKRPEKAQTSLQSIDQFAQHNIKKWHNTQKVQVELNEWNTKLKKCLKSVYSIREKVKKLESKISYEYFGNLIMTHLQEIKKGDEVVSLQDYSTSDTVIVSLKPELTPLQNAERYYKKSRNERKELIISKNTLQKREKELDEINFYLRKLHDQIESENVIFFQKKQPEVPSKKVIPFREFNFQGFQICVGKNAKNNDELTFKFSNKNDLWFHARDTPGSHVIIRKKNHQATPKPVIEFAASIAAYYSGRKTEKLCAVQYTERKYVRKVKKGAPGQVILDREQVIFVEPYLPVANQFD